MDAKSLSLKRPPDSQWAPPSKRSKTSKLKNTKKASTRRKKSAVNNNERVREEQFLISFEESAVLSRVKQEPTTDDDLVIVKTEVMPECRFETVLCGTGYVGMEEEEVNDRDTTLEEEIMGGKDQQEILQLSISERWSSLLKRSSALIVDCARPTGLPDCTLNSDYSSSVGNGPIYSKQEVNETPHNENQNPSDLKFENQDSCELSCNDQEMSGSIIPKLEVSELKYENIESSDLLCEKQENIEVSENQTIEPTCASQKKWEVSSKSQEASELKCEDQEASELSSASQEASEPTCESQKTRKVSSTSQEGSEPIIASQETHELSVGSQGTVIDSELVDS